MSTISPNNNLSPLAFYSSLDAREQWWGYGRTPNICVPKRTYPSFQLRRPHNTLAYRKVDDILGWDISDSHILDSEGQLEETEALINTLTYEDEAGVGFSSFTLVLNEDAISNIRETLEMEEGDDLVVMAADYDNGEEELTQVWKDSDNLEDITLPAGTIALRILGNISEAGMSGDAVEWVIMQQTIAPIIKFNLRGTDDDAIVLSGVPSVLKIVNVGSYDYIFLTNTSIASNIDEKTYYLEIGDGTNTWYSDNFTMRNADYLKLEWWNESNLEMADGTVVVAKDSASPYVSYIATLYLSTDIGMPDYEFEEEVEERGGYQFPLQQISYKKYKFNFLAPEVVCDAMRLVRLADHIQITKGEKVYTANTFLMTPTWQGQGYLAAVDCEFTTDTIVKKNGLTI